MSNKDKILKLLESVDEIVDAVGTEGVSYKEAKLEIIQCAVDNKSDGNLSEFLSWFEDGDF